MTVPVFTTLPFSMTVYGNQEAVLSVRMKTNWIDRKALKATPNIIQQGLYVQPSQIKISIHSGLVPLDHHAQCRVAGAGGGVINAQGPKSIDVADGNWHTITCVKFPDSTGGSSVQVTVDGVAGPVYRIPGHIGNMINKDAVDLRGQGPTANVDSIDGQYISVTYSVGWTPKRRGAQTDPSNPARSTSCTTAGGCPGGSSRHVRIRVVGGEGWSSTPRRPGCKYYHWRR